MNINTRHIGIIGLAALGLALAAPVQAAPNRIDGAFVIAKRDRGDEASRRDRRDERTDERRAPRGDAEREEPQGYGYGYERRQRHDREDENRPRGRR